MQQWRYDKGRTIMTTLTGVFYEGDGFIRRGLSDVPATKPVTVVAKQEAPVEIEAGAWEPALGVFELQMQARALRREHVNQWFRSLFDKNA